MVGTGILFHCYYSFDFCVRKSSTTLTVLVKFTIQISNSPGKCAKLFLRSGDIDRLLKTVEQHVVCAAIAR